MSSPSFQCLRCGNCCRHKGQVKLREGEIEAIAGQLGMTVDAFIARYTRLRPDRQGLSLTEAPDGSCVFLENSPTSCRIQAAKPGQCREFPISWKYPDLEQVCVAARTPRSS